MSLKALPFICCALLQASTALCADGLGMPSAKTQQPDQTIDIQPVPPAVNAPATHEPVQRNPNKPAVTPEKPVASTLPSQANTDY